MNSSIWRVDVVVMPKDGVSDPQGEAVKGGLIMLGHASVARVRVGRHIEIDIEAETVMMPVARSPEWPTSCSPTR